MKRRICVLATILALVLMSALMPSVAKAHGGTSSSGAAITTSNQPDFGTNVCVFDPSMPLSQIQTTVDAIATQQVDNEFGTQRYALLFKPGTYGTPTNPLDFQAGYYTEVAGLEASPTDVTINGRIEVYDRCLAPTTASHSSTSGAHCRTSPSTSTVWVSPPAEPLPTSGLSPRRRRCGG